MNPVSLPALLSGFPPVLADVLYLPVPDLSVVTLIVCAELVIAAVVIFFVIIRRRRRK